jgi:hypothetical protein
MNIRIMTDGSRFGNWIIFRRPIIPELSEKAPPHVPKEDGCSRVGPGVVR